MGFKVTGVDNVLKNLDRLVHEAKKAAVAAVKTEAEAVLGRAKERTPVDTGALRASGQVVHNETNRNELQIIFGGPSAPYAPQVHEDMAATHNDGQAKFLESALVEAEPGMVQRIAAGVKRRIR